MPISMNSRISPWIWRPATRRLLSKAIASPAAASSRRRLITTSSKSGPSCCCCSSQLAAYRRSINGASVLSFSTTAARHRSPPRQQEPQETPQPADDPSFTSILDNPPELVRSGRRHGPGIIFLAIIPIAAFALGTWQVYRLRWKTDLLAKCEDRLVRPPLPLNPQNVAAAVAHSQGAAAESNAADEGGGAQDFDYRRIVAVGTFRHDQEMLLGPRVRDGHAGYFVVTPLELYDPDAARGTAPVRILVNRGWIAREQRSQVARAQIPGALPGGLVRVEGMLRAPWKKNMFTPENRPDKGEFYFPDVAGMAQLTSSLPVWVEATMEPDLLQVYDMEAKGVPIGKPAEVNLRNNHAQYIFTWYSLSVATAIMLWMVARKPPSDIARRVRMNKNW